jgi:hypothetical protein
MFCLNDFITPSVPWPAKGHHKFMKTGWVAATDIGFAWCRYGPYTGVTQEP